MAKKKKPILKKLKVELSGGQATPAPPVGPVLGQAGINIMEFFKAFNDVTKDQMGMTIPVVITVYDDRSFDFELKSPPAAVLIKKMLNVEKGSANSKKEKIGQLTMAQVEEIANLKFKDLNAFDLKKAVKVISGTARSMGVEVKK